MFPEGEVVAGPKGLSERGQRHLGGWIPGLIAEAFFVAHILRRALSRKIALMGNNGNSFNKFSPSV